jgi:hypothetical protein
MLSGLRGRTSTTTSCSSSEISAGKPSFYDKDNFGKSAPAKEKRPEPGACFPE